MKAIETDKALTRIKKECKKSPDPVSYVGRELKEGDHHWQGDLAIIVTFEKLPPHREGWEGGNQLALGNTRGSRHCILEPLNDELQLVTLRDRGALDGPIIVAKRKFTVTHPEHGDVTWPAGNYKIRYQRQFAEELKRVQD